MSTTRPPEDRSLVTQAARERAPLRTSDGGHVSGARGRTNGLTNGVRGRTNGLTNGLGHTNGLTNGLRGRTNGLTNGLPGKTTNAGYVNGLRLRRNQSGVVYPSDLRRSGVILAASIVFMLAAAYFFGTSAPVPSPFQVDGQFSEWTNVPQYSDPSDAMPADADLVAFAVHFEAGDLLAYAKARGPLFVNDAPSMLFLLIDDPHVVGYHVTGMDADFIVEVWGWNATLQGTRFWEWSGGSDRDNSSALDGVGGVSAASAGSELELRVPGWLLPTTAPEDLRFAVSTWSAGWTDSGIVVKGLPGALVVTQRPLTHHVATRTAVLEVRFHAILSDVVVRNLTIAHTGGGVVEPPSFPLIVPAGQDRVAYVWLDPAGMPPGELASLGITAADASAVNETRLVPITVTGPATRVYGGTVPSGYVVDGLFAEWTNVTADPADNLPPSVDILASASAVPGDGFFYVETEGDVLAGAVLPKAPTKPVPSSGSGTPQPVTPAHRIAAEDLLRIYVDVDDRDTAGYPVGGIHADRLLDVRGRNGRITARTLSTWNASVGSWTPYVESPDVALEGTQLEARMPAGFLGAVYRPRVVFEATDWSGASDLAELAALSVPFLTAAAIEPLHGPGSESISATSLINTPTVDGSCPTTPTEYSGGSAFVGPTLSFTVGRRDDTQFLYVCIQATSDTSENAFDTAWIMFDRAHDGGVAPRTDDLRFSVDHSQSFVVEAGTGSGWTKKGVIRDPGDVGANTFSGVQQYEFRIRYSDVWGTNAPTPGTTSGFAIVVLERGLYTFYRWGSSAVNENVPDTWGHLVLPIPEFPVPLVAVSTIVGLLAYRRHRRSAT